MSKYLNVSLVKVKLDNTLKKYSTTLSVGILFPPSGCFPGGASLVKAGAGGTQESVKGRGLDPASLGTRA